MLTKSDFVKYAQCLKYLWLGKYKKELATPPDAAQQALFDEGYEVEAYALKMFPSAKHASVGDFKQSINESSQLIQEEAPVIFQPTIAGNDLYARCEFWFITNAQKNGILLKSRTVLVSKMNI